MLSVLSLLPLRVTNYDFKRKLRHMPSGPLESFLLSHLQILHTWIIFALTSLDHGILLDRQCSPNVGTPGESGCEHFLYTGIARHTTKPLTLGLPSAPMCQKSPPQRSHSCEPEDIHRVCSQVTSKSTSHSSGIISCC